MLSLHSILMFIHDNLKSNPERFKIVDEEHILDNKTGVELHLYDNWFKLTREGETIATIADFTKDEQEVVWKIKMQLTTPEKVKEKRDRFLELAAEKRMKVSELFEYPTSLNDNKVEAETDVEAYTG